MKVFDAFLYAGLSAEPDLLQLRVEELRGLVDCHVAVIGDRTFQGAPLPAYWAFPSELAPFHPHFVTLPEHAAHPMERERVQRDAIKQAVDHAGAEPDDLVIISDVDELPKPHIIAYFRDAPPTRPVRLGERIYHYWLNLRITGGEPALADGYLYNPVIVRRRDLDSRGAHDWRWSGDGFRVPDAAWSWSFLGDVETHREKLSAWSHHEWDQPPYNTPENIERARRLGIDWDFTRQLQHEWVPETLDSSYPRTMLAHLDRWAKYIAAPPVEVPVS